MKEPFDASRFNIQKRQRSQGVEDAGRQLGQAAPTQAPAKIQSLKGIQEWTRVLAWTRYTCHMWSNGCDSNTYNSVSAVVASTNPAGSA